MEKLTDELYIHCLMYLRAVDLAVVMELNKAARPRVAIAVKRIMEETPMLPHHNSPCRKQLLQAYTLYRPESLFIFEVSCVLSALAFPQPLFGKGYWISASWASNAKKYFEALSLPDISSLPPSNVATTLSPSVSGNRSPPSSAHKLFTSPGSHSNSGTKKRQQTKIRQRRGSDALPPWPIINADLLCCHNNLALSKAPKAKRRAIDSRAWFLLRKYYPEGPQYKCKNAVECLVCAGEDQSTKTMIAERRENEIAQRRCNYLPTALMALSMRKNGVPSHCLAASNVYLVEGDDGEGGITLEPLVYHPIRSPANSSGSYLTTGSWPPQTALPSSGMETANSTAAVDEWIAQQAEQSTGHTTAGTSTPLAGEYHSHINSAHNQTDVNSTLNGPPPPSYHEEYSISPLVAGLYNLVPREWLRQWRRYTKDPSVNSLPLLDCTSLLCYAHGLLLIPPHVEDYLVSLRRSLLSGLGSYTGEVVEIVTAEEWDALQEVAHQHQRRFVTGQSPPTRALVSSIASQVAGTTGASHSAGEFGVRFCLDSGGQVSWSLPVCHLCDPLLISGQHHHLMPVALPLR